MADKINVTKIPTRAISDVMAIGALVRGGYICQICRPCSNKRTYEVFKPDVTAPSGSTYIGHITERQFLSFMEEGIAVYAEEPPYRDKYGNLYNYCWLADRRRARG